MSDKVVVYELIYGKLTQFLVIILSINFLTNIYQHELFVILLVWILISHIGNYMSHTL